LKTLLLLRHAKSSWAEAGRADHDRPLNARGLRDAPRMGELLRDEGLEPDGVVASTARRARETADLVVDAGGFDGAVALDEDLYGADVDAILEVVRRYGAAAQTLLVVGHNPGMEEVLEHLTDAQEHMATATLAAIEVAIDDWGELDDGTVGRLVGLWRPRELDHR
jgi:phosphohistidine phosphatase